ncbi:hypothetical protein K439DRAFT_1620385 [Ramaria rubella]|nr:hypothetical protein K439DRAFT_1620385 [Ramaria rubella]
MAGTKKGSQAPSGHFISVAPPPIPLLSDPKQLSTHEKNTQKPSTIDEELAADEKNIANAMILLHNGGSAPQTRPEQAGAGDEEFIDVEGIDELEDNDETDIKEDDGTALTNNVVQMVFDIQFEVPCGNAVVNIEVKSSQRFMDIMLTIAEAMGLRVHAFQIGYVLSWLPKSPHPKPKLLANEKHLQIMVCDIATWMENERCKNKGKGVVQHCTYFTFSCILHSPLEIQKQKMVPTVSGEHSSHVANEGVSRDGGIKEHEVLHKIEEFHRCESCNHYPFTMTDKSLWAKLVAEGKAKIEKIPTFIVIPPSQEEQAAAKSTSRREGSDDMHAEPAHEYSPHGRQCAKSSSPDLCSPLSDWLKELDDHPIHGRDDQNYQQYADLFARAQLLQLKGRLNGKDLKAICEDVGGSANLPLGITFHLLRFASEDKEELLHTLGRLPKKPHHS